MTSLGLLHSSFIRHFYTAKPISLPCLCKTEGVKSSVMERAFLVHWRRQGYARRVDLFRIICMKSLVFYDSRDSSKNEYTSQCRLQKQTIYKCKNANIFFVLLTTCCPDKSFVRTVPLRLSRRSHHLSLV